MRRIASLAIALFAAPALAIAAQGPDVAAWLKQNTDLPRAEVVIAGPDVVYGFEALTPRLATGEVIGLVRTEAMSPTWAASHHFRSWDAHVLVDCNGGRMRFIRSATYADANRQGAPTLRAESDAWIAPNPGEPAAKLVAAACDPGFQWPLRAAVAEAAPTPALATAALTTAPAPSSTNAPTTSPRPAARSEFAVQVAYGPYRAGADRALAKAQRLLGTTPDALVASTLRSQVGDARRYTAVLDGFSSAEAATQACATLAKAGQRCFMRRSPAVLQAREGAQPPAPTIERAKANAPKTPRKALGTAAAHSIRHVELASAVGVAPPARAGSSRCATPASPSQRAGACAAARRPQRLEARAESPPALRRNRRA